jgi:hypothetical protein
MSLHDRRAWAGVFALGRGFRVWDVGRCWSGLGCGVQGLGLRLMVQSLWFMVHGSWFRIQGSGFVRGVQGSGFIVQGSERCLQGSWFPNYDDPIIAGAGEVRGRQCAGHALLRTRQVHMDLSGRSTARADDAQGASTQSHISPIVLVHEDERSI